MNSTKKVKAFLVIAHNNEQSTRFVGITTDYEEARQWAKATDFFGAELITPIEVEVGENTIRYRK